MIRRDYSWLKPPRSDSAIIRIISLFIHPPSRYPNTINFFANNMVIGGSLKLAHLRNEPDRNAQLIASYYSRALDYWAVEAQKSGKLEKAGVDFERALKLNPGNLVAQINLECNRNVQAGRKAAAQITKSV